MAYSPTEVNEKYWRKLTEAASQSLQEKMNLLDDVDGFTRDDSFLGNKAPNHMMYKLESLYSKDGHRGYAENGRYPPTQNGDIRSLFMLFALMAMQN